MCTRSHLNRGSGTGNNLHKKKKYKCGQVALNKQLSKALNHCKKQGKHVNAYIIVKCKKTSKQVNQKMRNKDVYTRYKMQK